LEQNVRDKAVRQIVLLCEHGFCRENSTFNGDDLNNLGAMRLCGFVRCSLDACAEIREMAYYISLYKEGDGAVRDVITFLLCAHR
jgi:3-deoxy-D-manno-octulosonate 8-phosphate phosphatase (KDO 8-P phosphatase)